MLIVKSIQDKKLQEEYCRICAAEYTERNFAYSVFDNDEFIGICDFNISSEGGAIFNLAAKPGCSDLGALEITGRAVLSFMENCGVKKAFYHVRTETDKTLAARMKFKLQAEGVYIANLDGYFDHPCAN